MNGRIEWVDEERLIKVFKTLQGVFDIRSIQGAGQVLVSIDWQFNNTEPLKVATADRIGTQRPLFPIPCFN